MARTYQSPERAAQAERTREAIIEAATTAFLERGYAATTIAAVARNAGVSGPTIEATFGTKARLLKAAIDVAIVGDHESVGVLDRGWAIATDPPQFLDAVGVALRDAQLRSAGLVLAVFEGGTVDDELQALGEQLVAQRLVTAGWIVDRLPRRAGMTRRDAVDTVWLLMDSAVFVRLTRDRGWTPTRYGRWFAATAARLVLDPEPTRRSKR